MVATGLAAPPPASAQVEVEADPIAYGLLEHLHASAAPMSVVQFRVLGGAVAAWVAELTQALPTASGAYVGFLADEGPDGVLAAYPGSTGERLRHVKALWDPENRFRLNHNVVPATADGRS